MSQQQQSYSLREQSSSSLQVKRCLFHSSIRKQQLDRYKDKKRLQYFGYSLKKGDNQCQKQQQSYHHEKKKVERFMLQIWVQKLNGQNYSLQIINEIAYELDRMNMRGLINTQIYTNKEFEFTIQLVGSMLQAWIKQEGFSKQGAFPMFNSLKQILSNLIRKQQSQFSQTLKNKRTKAYLSRILQGKVAQTRNVNLKEIERQLKDLQSQEQELIIHPLESCWVQVKEIAELLANLSFILCQQSSPIQPNTPKNPLYNQPHLLTQPQQLFTITSLLTHPIYTKQLLSIFLKMITSLKYLPESIIDTLIESLHNYVSMQNIKDKQKVIISYDNQSLVMITKCFSMIMNSFTLSSSCSNNIVKSLIHLFYTHQQVYMPTFLNSQIMKQLLQPYETQREENFNLWVMLETEQISPQQFIDMYVQQQRMQRNQKADLLHLIGVVFNYVSTKSYLKQTFEYLPIIIELVHYQIRQLSKINTAKQSIFIDNKRFSEQIPIDDHQHITQYALFVLRNLFGVCIDVTNGFIQRNGLSDLLNLWQHMSLIEDIVGKDVTGIFSVKKIDQARRIKIIIIDCVYNMTTMLVSEYSNLQSLQIFIEYKHSAIIKLLLHHIKSLTYNQDLLYFSQQKQCLGYALLALRKLLRFVVCDGYSVRLVDDLEHSGGEFGGEMMREVITVIMMGEDVYGKYVSDMAVKCLELVDEVLKCAQWGNPQGATQPKSEQYQHFQNNQNPNFTNSSNTNQSQGQQFEI